MPILKKLPEEAWIVHLTTYPPRECGLATFSSDLISYSDELFLEKIETKVIAMNTVSDVKHKYPSKVILEISENNKEEYILAAEKLNVMPEVKMVCVQHEFGIFGENYGENIILFLENLSKPVSITFHTVLPQPAEAMKRIMEKILNRAELLIVMTELSKKILMEVYGAEVDKIKVIPHGIHPQLYTDTNTAKKKLGLENKLVLTTFGLLSRGKGIEYAIKALPGIIEKHPNIIYLVLGQTHPVVLNNEGEKYRDELLKEVSRLGLEKHVIFYNKYLLNEDIFLYLQATDIYLSLSQDPNQTVSGTLTYALGTGRAIISTAFMQAKEIVTPDVGILIGFNDEKIITSEVLRLLDDPGRLENMGKTAYFLTRSMTWPNVALSYMSSFVPLLNSMSEKNKYLLPINIDYLEDLTDNLGILQFASLNDPDPKWGYTLDDNARALVALCWYQNIRIDQENEETRKINSLVDIYLKFIEQASKEQGGFVNYFNIEREPHDELDKKENLEDANARALWALSVAGKSKIPSLMKERAANLFKKQFVLHKDISSPRAAAFYIKAFTECVANKESDPEITDNIKRYADFLVDLFERSSDGNWEWFEESLTYSNALLPEALLAAYTVTENPIYFKIAQASLDFLIEHSFEGEVCVPVGQKGWFKKGGQKEIYDQQPEEVSALVLALHQMVLVDDNPLYREKLMLAFDWFLGNNLSKQVVYTHFTGGCYDGIIKGGINLNQGSESTISYLLARLVMESSQQ